MRWNCSHACLNISWYTCLRRYMYVCVRRGCVYLRVRVYVCTCVCGCVYICHLLAFRLQLYLVRCLFSLLWNIVNHTKKLPFNCPKQCIFFNGLKNVPKLFSHTGRPFEIFDGPVTDLEPCVKNVPKLCVNGMEPCNIFNGPNNVPKFFSSDLFASVRFPAGSETKSRL